MSYSLEFTEVWLLTLQFSGPYPLGLLLFSKSNIMIFQPITRTYKATYFPPLVFPHVHLIEHKRIRRFLSYAFSLSVCVSLNVTSSFIFCHLLFKSYSHKFGVFVQFRNRYISFPSFSHYI